MFFAGCSMLQFGAVCMMRLFPHGCTAKAPTLSICASQAIIKAVFLAA